MGVEAVGIAIQERETQVNNPQILQVELDPAQISGSAFYRVV